MLAGNRGQVADGRIDRLRVLQCLAETDVHDDLRETRNVHRVGIAELLPPGRNRLFLVALMEAAAHSPGSNCSRQWPHTRTLWPEPRRSCLTRVTRSQRGQTSITLLASIGIGFSTMPPGVTCACVFLLIVWRGLVCRLAMLTPAIMTATGRVVGAPPNGLP